MENTPELHSQAKFLGSITSEFVRVADTLHDAAEAIRDRQLSQYPIFVFGREPVALGALLIDPLPIKLRWHVFASTLEEFVQRGLVATGEGEAAFRAAYKDPDEYACLFVVDPEFMEFVTLPYPVDEDAVVE